MECEATVSDTTRAWRATWRRRVASAAQLAALQRRGLDVPSEVTRAEARALLRGLRVSKRLRPVDIATVSGKCRLCESEHPDTTSIACRTWARRRYEWLCGELARLHALLFCGSGTST
jgi:hypothetical protein